MNTYRLEMLHGQDMRTVQADTFVIHENWLVFHRRPAMGGSREYWRTRIDCVVSVETVPQ